MENLRTTLTQLRSRRSERNALILVSAVFIGVNLRLLIASLSLLVNSIVAATLTVAVLAAVCPDGVCRRLVRRLGQKLDSGEFEAAFERVEHTMQRVAQKVRITRP